MAIDTNVLLEQADLPSIVESYGIDLIDQGGDFIALCPFHPDQKSKSFRIYSHTQSYFCFGCKAGGNAISFIMQFEGVPFREALTKLAQKVGYDESGFGFRDLSPKKTQKNVAALRERVENSATTTLRDIYFRVKEDDSLTDCTSILYEIDGVWKWYDDYQVKITSTILRDGYNCESVEALVYMFYAEFLQKVKYIEGIISESKSKTFR